MGIFSKIFGTYSDRQIKRILPIVDKIEELAETFKNKSDEELKAYTLKLKEDLKSGLTLDDILPEAFALVREADTRVLGKRPFRVQLIGGILLHQGRIAEMRTGEGKTLVATLPAYLNALSEKGVHIVTVNDYLATRDSEEMGRVYSFLGLSTGLIVHGQTHEEKKKAYSADITYGTNNEFGFDYLRDNMALYKDRMVQRGHNFVIIDEVDSILIDEARTPLIISGMGEKSTELYQLADRFARTLRKCVIKEMDTKQDTDTYEEDYIVDEKARTTVLTKHGVEKAEKFFHIDNLSDPQNNTLYHHITTAIRAYGIMKRDVDYIVKDGAVVIVDSFTGRLMPGRRYNDGLHQAIEAKEGVSVQKESVTLATVTFQNYFRMYKKLSGMTGTAMTEDNEFREIYALDVVEVPTNKPMIRKDHNDAVYRTYQGKMRAIVRQIKECNEKGQPVLVGTVSIDKSEELSLLLKRNGIKHNVLNAKQHEKEAEIVAQAGKLGAVTISTNMAGRGTDIMLGGNPEFMAKNEMRRMGIEENLIQNANGTQETFDEELLEARKTYSALYEKYKEQIRPEADMVRNAGGLFILGTERHESRRIDNQLRGRSGRQGDAGESRFYLSLEDDLLRLFGTDRLIGLTGRLGLDEDTPIDAGIISNSIESAQRRIETNNFERRKRVLTYDDVMNQQRQLIYKQRMDVLCEKDIRDKIIGFIEASVSDAFDTHLLNDFNSDAFVEYYRGLLSDTAWLKERENDDRDGLKEALIEKALKIYENKEELFGNLIGANDASVVEKSNSATAINNPMREVEKIILLRNVDSKWTEHLDNMEDLKEYVGLNAYAQRDPATMYRIEGAQLFEDLSLDIRENTVKQILAVVPKSGPMQRESVNKVSSEGFAGGDGSKRIRRPVKVQKVGRNDPCPCGSGKKYKKCCGAGSGEEKGE